MKTSLLTRSLLGIVLFLHIASHPLADTSPTDAVASSVPPPTPYELIKTAEGLIESMDVLKIDWPKVIELSGQILLQVPDNVPALTLRGWAYAETGRFDQALADMNMATTLAPLNDVAWGMLCRTQILAGHSGGARAACANAVGLNDENNAWYFFLGHTWLLQGQKVEAARWYKKAIPTMDDEGSLRFGLNDFDLFIQQGWQPQLAEDAKRWFEAEGRKWLAQKAQADQLERDYGAASNSKEWETAIAIQKQRIPVLEALYGAMHPNASAARILAPLYASTGRRAEAEAMFRERIALLEKALGPDHTYVADTLMDFGQFLTPHYALVLPHYRRALAIYEKAFGPEHPKLLRILAPLASAYAFYGGWMSRQAEAEAMNNRYLSLVEKIHGLTSDDLLGPISDVVDAHIVRGRYTEAEDLIKRALAIAGKYYAPEDDQVDTAFWLLVGVYEASGQRTEAQTLYRNRLPIYEKDVKKNYQTIATLYIKLGRDVEVEPLFRRVLVIAEDTHGPDHKEVQNVLLEAGKVYRFWKGHEAEAIPYLKRAVTIHEKVYGSDRASTIRTLLAGVYTELGRYSEAEPLYEREFLLEDKVFESARDNNLRLGLTEALERKMLMLADCYKAQGRNDLAEPLYQRGFDLIKKRLALEEIGVGSAWASFTDTLFNSVVRFYRAGWYAQGLPYSRRAYLLLKQRYAQAGDEPRGEGFQQALLAEQQAKSSLFVRHIYFLSRSGDPAAAAESFEAAQLAQASSVGQSVAQMTARFAASDGELAQVIRQRQDASDYLIRIEKALSKATAKAPDERNADREAQMRDTLASLERALQEQTQGIARRFPKYDSLVSPAPVAVAEIQKLLHRDEALLFYLNPSTLENGYGNREEGGFVWLVQPRAVSFIHLDIPTNKLDEQVGNLRSRLDPEQNPSLTPFDAAASHALYQKLFAPLERKLKGVRHIILVSSGALQSLPLGVLVDSPPVDGTPPSWLADRFTFSVLPSVSSLRALRVFSKAKPGTNPFAGFGNPLLQGKPGPSRRLSARALFSRGLATGNGSLATGIADVEQIRKATPLPETEVELRAMAGALKAPASSITVGALATETRVKQSDLTPYRVLAFSTHGVMAGELSGLAEPGLILTPPSTGTALDDGYLSASEVAQLKLNADWVILAACNTAAPDGKPGAEGLSGLAKAFFYAGARSLLVSNWYVDSDATTRLSTAMFRQYARQPAHGKAAALQAAMRELRADPKFDHPLFWAPFSVVGEAGRVNTRTLQRVAQ